ncbi:MAG TPA: hypothetical protein VLJ86_20805, partial [Ramlibacter sp.]|nr:hypothetical protein [Ramlibacter sp.]
GASGPAVVASIDAQTAAVNAKAKAFDAGRSRADARRQAYRSRTQELRLAVSRRLTRAKQALPKSAERLAAFQKTNEIPAFQRIVDLGVDPEVVKRMGVPDIEGNAQRERERLEQEANDMRKEIVALEAFDRDKDPAHLAGLGGFDELIATQRSIEAQPL